jgi:hypothetical protein
VEEKLKAGLQKPIWNTSFAFSYIMNYLTRKVGIWRKKIKIM